MMRGSSGGSGGSRRESLDDPLALRQDDQMSDDDNAAPDMQSEVEGEKEDPLLLAIDDLEGRVVSALDDFKLHPGIRSSSAPGSPTVHDELGTLLRPVLEVAAHTGPSVARTYYPVAAGGEGVEVSCADVYNRVISDLVLPVMLEMVQSDTIPAKRAASLEFFRNFWKECHKAGSWLDKTTTGPNIGPYGPGGSSYHHHAGVSAAAAPRNQQKRRHAKKMEREAEILRYWVQGSIACTLPGAFTSEASEGAVASRGIIAASASLRPSLKHIAERIQDADDRGAARLYGPVMKMVEGVLQKLFLSIEADAQRSACIKFLEIVVLCCSSKKQLTTKGPEARRRRENVEDFSLEDLPAGHPVITREALESIAEYAFACLRGMVIMGGQVKIDVNLLSDMILSGDVDGTPSSQVVSILKPAALAFLELESSVKHQGDTNPAFKVDRANTDMDFTLDHKSFTVAINAVSMLAINRPLFYAEAATCLARRAYDPPVATVGSALTKSAVLAISAQLRASCLTLLRNTLSVTTNRTEILQKALVKNDMEVQADKAVTAARQAAALKTAGRETRNRAAMFYEWDASEGDKRVSKRQRETDDALAKMRAAKAKRGLGHGVMLPTSMVDAVELILLNLPHLPTSRPPDSTKSTKARETSISLDFVVEAVMSNGASLSKKDGQWYAHDGGNAWFIEMTDEPRYSLESTVLSAAEVEHDKSKAAELDEKAKGLPKLFNEQCRTAASDAFGRIVSTSSGARTEYQRELANKIAAKLAWTLIGVPPPSNLQSAFQMAEESVKSLSRQIEEVGGSFITVNEFVTTHPLVSSCLTLEVAQNGPPLAAKATSTSTLCNFVLNEAYVEACSVDKVEKEEKDDLYGRSLEVYAASVSHASELANDKPSDLDRKRVASLAAASLPQRFGELPLVNASALSLITALCEIEEIARKAAEATRKSSQQTIAVSAAVHAAKVAAEKRATSALLALRDTAFQRTNLESRTGAVNCAVAVAAGRYPTVPSVEDKALKLVMNILFSRSEALSDVVAEAATQELKRASDFAIENYSKIHDANKKDPLKADKHKKHSVAGSEEEKKALERVKKPAVLFMALCVRRPEMIETLMVLSCKKKADLLLKAVQANMPKMARAAATKHGAANIALKVSAVASDDEVPLVLAFLDNIAPSSAKDLPPQDLIDACFKIQGTRSLPDGKRDARFIIPVVIGMLRKDLVEKLPEFVAAKDEIFLAALEKMASRVSRQALLFRDEPDPETPSLHGMTQCEQLVFLHQMDFAAVGLPQKRYLDAIRLCLEDDNVFTDRVVMAALDYISGKFLTTDEKLPLAYMRTIILTCSKHEALHSWICHVLLPRLIEGEIYKDRRQWEGWMRCAKMLENTGDTGVSSLEAISKLPHEQLVMYRAKYPS